MSREIKFRYLITGSNGIPIMSVFPLEGLVDDLIMLDHIRAKRTIKFCGEYTGLCDKSGKEIYEGDVLQAGSPISRKVVAWHTERGMWIGQDGFNEPLFHDLNLFEVIGNIHEHPELLKK